MKTLVAITVMGFLSACVTKPGADQTSEVIMNKNKELVSEFLAISAQVTLIVPLNSSATRQAGGCQATSHFWVQRRRANI